MGPIILSFFTNKHLQYINSLTFIPVSLAFENTLYLCYIVKNGCKFVIKQIFYFIILLAFHKILLQRSDLPFLNTHKPVQYKIFS